MSPFTLATLPAEALQRQAQPLSGDTGLPSPHGERQERRLALFALLGLSLLLAGWLLSR